MDEGSSQKKNRMMDAVVAAVNLAAMGSAVNSSAVAKESTIIEKKIDELGAKLERLSEQIKSLQAPQQEQKLAVASDNPAAVDKKPEVVQQVKAQDVIYVRKATEFSFYS